MAKSWHHWAAILGVALHGSDLHAQWGSGPTLSPAAAAVTNSGNYTAPPVVTMPAVPNPVPLATAPAVPVLAAPAAPAYNPLPIPAAAAPVLTNMPAALPAQAQPAAAANPGSAPVGTPIPTPYGGGASYTTAGPSSYTLPSYSPATSYAPSGAPAASPYSLQQPSAFTGQGMPAGSLAPQDIAPFAKPQSPPSYSTWLPTKFASLMPHSWTGSAIGTSPAVPNDGGYAGTAAGCNPCNSGCNLLCDPCGNWYDNFYLISAYDAFKGPVDLDGLNGNFGKRLGGMASFPILREWGLGGQVGGTYGWYDPKGSLYTGDDHRTQVFATAGIFQRSCTTGLGWAVVHDWLFDDYYADLHLSQFRVAGSWQFDCNNEIGVWSALPQARDEAFVGTPAVEQRYQTVLQGNLYWRHLWSNCASSTIYAGIAESPSDIPWGGNVQVAVNQYVAVVGAVTYILPGSGSNDGRQEEIWNLSLGLQFYPGTAMQAVRSQFRPYLPMADNGNFAVWRH